MSRWWCGLPGAEPGARIEMLPDRSPVHGSSVHAGAADGNGARESEWGKEGLSLMHAAIMVGASVLAILCAATVSSPCALAQSQAAKPDTSASAAGPVTITSRPLGGFEKLDQGRTNFGRLQWLGGLVLSSSDPRFGGWSGLAIDADGRRLVAVSDAGTWMTAELVYQKGRPAGLERARIGPLKAKDGGPLKRDRDRDAEAIVLSSGSLAKGRVMIAFEQNHRIGVFDITSEGLHAPSGYLAVPAEAKRMRPLRGFEVLTELRSGAYKGALLAIAERFPDAKGRHSGWIIKRGAAHRFALTDIDGYEPTDAVALANGDVIVLERRFRWLEGVKMRLRRIASGELKPGAVIAGEVLLDADMSQEIDNMEAMAAHPDASGATVLTIMSDDNFNGFLQRTLLLQFRLADHRSAQQ